MADLTPEEIRAIESGLGAAAFPGTTPRESGGGLPPRRTEGCSRFGEDRRSSSSGEDDGDGSDDDWSDDDCDESADEERGGGGGGGGGGRRPPRPPLASPATSRRKRRRGPDDASPPRVSGTDGPSSDSSSSSRPRSGAARRPSQPYIARWIKVLSHDVDSRKLKFLWRSGAREWETWAGHEDALNKPVGCDLVIRYLSRQRPASRKLSDWIKEVEEFRAVCAAQLEDDPAPEPYQLAFCCHACRCTEEEKDSECFVTAGNSGNGSLWHRSCCHNWESQGEDWVPPVKKTIESAIENLTALSEKKKPTCDAHELKAKEKQAAKEEAKVVNALSDTDPMVTAYSNEAFINFCKIFKNVEKGNLQGRGATVLEMFGGIGGGTVALKRSQIAIRKLIYVDHDPVAKHVYRFNHDKSYNETLPEDGIHHVYQYDTFEAVRDSLDTFMRDHAPIDVIIGGPPCPDFSGINVHREGIDGPQGKYLPAFGELITAIRNHPRQRGQPVFFLSENVVFPDNSHDSEVVTKAHGVPRICLDAKDFSPCKRNRIYFTSIPVERYDFEGAAAESSASRCLSDGWKTPAEAAAGGRLGVFKANTFLASKSRVDDLPRMAKVKFLPDENCFAVDAYEVSEREAMLGFPTGYAERAVDDLFTALRKAFEAELEEGSTWFFDLDERLVHFAEQEWKFKQVLEPPFFDIMMAPPVLNKSNPFFDRDEYAKRLLGNSFSIPVVEHLLKPLRRVFRQRKYEGYGYCFSWPPYNCRNSVDSSAEEDSPDSDADSNLGLGERGFV